MLITASNELSIYRFLEYNISINSLRVVKIVNEEEILENLQSFGLTKYESEIYFLLLKYGKIAASKLGKISKVPVTRIYDITQSLAEKGLIGLANHSPKEYCALPIEGAFETLIAKKKETFQKDIAGLEIKKKTVLAAISAIPERKIIDTTAFCIALNGKKAILPACHSLFFNAKKEVLIFSGDSSWINAELPRIKGMLKKGIDLRIIANAKYPENLAVAKKIGVSIRLSDNLLRGIIADRKYLYLLKKHIDLTAFGEFPGNEKINSPNGANAGDIAKNCWEFWDCNKSVKESCAAYVKGIGRECWIIAGTSGNKECPRLKKGFKSCVECPWFGKMNSLEEDYSCIIIEDKNTIESLREYFLMKWDSGQKL